MPKLKVKQGMTAGIFLAVFFVVASTATSNAPVETFLKITAVVSLVLLLEFVVLWRLNRNRPE
jgi:hypothetical protein